jgi:uncharacterized membrane protein
MSIVRFFMLLSLAVWVGGIIFFALVMAPAAFAVLPLRQYAGQIVSRTLDWLHGIGCASGIVFLITSMIHSRNVSGATQPFAGRHVLVIAMIVLTLISQFAISGRMLALRNEMRVIDEIAVTDPRRVEFNRLHQWSTRIEGAVLALGLLTIYLTARQLR